VCLLSMKRPLDWHPDQCERTKTDRNALSKQTMFVICKDPVRGLISTRIVWEPHDANIWKLKKGWNRKRLLQLHRINCTIHTF
jgi:hypothetical protein